MFGTSSAPHMHGFERTIPYRPVQYPSWGLLREEEGEWELAVDGSVILWHAASIAHNACLSLHEAGINTAVYAYQCAVCGERFTGDASDEMVEAVQRNGSHVACHYECSVQAELELA